MVTTLTEPSITRRRVRLFGAIVFAAALLVLAFSFALNALVRDRFWVTDETSDCWVWNPALTRIRWLGPCEDGKANGYGTLQVIENDEVIASYKARLVHGFLRGHGIKTWPGSQGGRYEGDVFDGAFSGHGVETWKDGSRYEGEWAHDRPNGLGTLSFPDGRVYSGKWRNGCFRQGKRWATLGATKAECGFLK